MPLARSPCRRSVALALTALLASCADVATSTTATDGGAATCTWRAGEVQRVATSFNGVCVLRDLAPTGGGAWLLTTCDTGPGSIVWWSNEAFLLDAAGATRSTRFEPGHGGVLNPDDSRDDLYSLAVDDGLNRRAALVWSTDDLPPGPLLLALDEAPGDTPTPGAVRPLASDLALVHYRHLRARRDGFTCFAEQVGARWGVSLVRLDPEGVAVSSRDLGLPTSSVPFQQISLPDRSFVMVWTESGELRLRRYDEDGAPRTDGSAVLDEQAPTDARVEVVPAGEGMLAVWETGGTLTARRLDADGTPTAEARVLAGSEGYAAGLHAAAAGRDVLVSAIVDAASPRLVVLTFDGEGAPRGELVAVTSTNAVLFQPELRTTRVVATPGGALMAFERERWIWAVPLTCAR